MDLFLGSLTPRLRWMGFWGSPEAEAKAMDLFLGSLTPYQRKQFAASGFFIVVGSHTGCHYKITTSRINNVSDADVTYCAGPAYLSLVGDVMLAQKLILEQDELSFLTVANISSLSGHVHGRNREEPQR